jgi:hypothetical protein
MDAGGEMTRTQRIVSNAILAGYVVTGAGVVALVTIGLFFWIGQPWGTINDLSLLVMTLALAPLMLAYYELGGWTPTPLAQAAQALGWLAVLAWCLIQALMVIGAVTFDYYAPAAGALALETFALVYIGLWIAGANLLAGPWLGTVRWLGVVSGIGVVVFCAGLLAGGVDHPLTVIGGLGYQVILPIWAFLVARGLRTVA